MRSWTGGRGSIAAALRPRDLPRSRRSIGSYRTGWDLQFDNDTRQTSLLRATMTVEAIYAPFFKYFRTRRMARFMREFGVSASTRILDVGGTPEIWSHLALQPKVVFTNLTAAAMGAATGVIADGRRLPFRDHAFDIVFSNSVIEHIGDWRMREEFAAECRRVGHRYYIQTPDWWFPIEPHCIAPFIHWMPERIRERLVRFTPRGILEARAGRPVDAFAHIDLLTCRDLAALFPDAEIWRERWCGLGKSLIAVRL
jgi:SAM-dependent methyltransferase